MIEKSNFLDYPLAKAIRDSYQTPVFVYDEKTLVKQAKSALAFPNAYGLTVRFAMKACPNAAILKVMLDLLNDVLKILITIFYNQAV
jgi:diaminopimelate decarboxylase